MKYALLITVTLIVFACNKKNDPVDPISSADKAKAAALTEFLKNDKLKLTKYYSETPIDYIDTDQVVKQETELWQYVSNWLKDDTYTFDAEGNVNVQQNVNRIETDTAAILTRHYSVAADPNGVKFDFLGHEYQDLNYRLISFSDTNLVVSASWNGKKVISEYHTVP
ncbi:MAG TPA: hypothetical protein VM101_16905 [Flavitalea sp.]|nr:hypothetical protein [Flavitalea sp.]